MPMGSSSPFTRVAEPKSARKLLAKNAAYLNANSSAADAPPLTTASRPNVEGVLRHFGLEDFFDLVVTQEDVKIAKPDPGCYNELIARCGVKREDCLIF